MTAAIEVRNLVKRFGGLVATNNLSFDLDEGESLGLIGPNGAGKTTVFAQIMGELAQTSGTIRFKGQEISGLSTSERISRGISRTYQVPRPFTELTVRENIRVGLMPNNIRQLVFGATDRVQEERFAKSVGFNLRNLDRSAAELSMGDLRKLEFARTLATGAKTLLLDEIFAGLTTGEIAMIADLIKQLRRQGFTFLIVSHDLPAITPLVDRVIAIELGALLAEGTMSEVLANEDVRASYLGES